MSARRRWTIVVGAALAAIVGLSVRVWLQTERSLQEASAAWADSAAIPITIRPYAPPPSYFQPISARPSQSSAALFDGGLWLGGPGGLSRRNPETGRLDLEWLPGRDLPPAPISALAVGRTRNGRELQLLAATQGQGLLVVSRSDELLQVLPSEHEYADLTAVLPLDTGTVLLGAERAGVLAWDGRQLKAFHQSLTGREVTALAGDEGDLWIGTLNDGIMHWSGGSITHIGEDQGLPDARVLSIEWRRDAVYVGTPLGVALFQGGLYQRTLAEGFFASSLAVLDDSLLVGSLDEGTIEIPLSSQPPPLREGSSGPLGPDGVQAFVTQDKSVLAVTRSQVYARPAASRSWRPLAAAESAGARDRNISALHRDGSQRLWVGYFDRGLDVLAPDFERVAEIESDRLFCVNRIKPHRNGRTTVVATANGLAYIDGAARLRQFLTREDGLLASHVTDILFTPDSTVLATPAGVTFLDSGGARSLYAFHGLVNNHVYSLSFSNGRVLAGTLGGLSFIEGGRVTDSFTTANSALSHNWVSALTVFEGDSFVGLYGGGVVRISSTGEWKDYPELDGVEINPNAMAASASHVYAGALDRGLLIYSAQEDAWRFVEDGLPSRNVTALAWAENTLYVGTDNGLSLIDEVQLIGK